MFCSYYKLFYFSINCFLGSCIPTTVLHSKKEIPTTLLHFRSATPIISSCPPLITHFSISKRCVPITNKFIIFAFSPNNITIFFTNYNNTTLFTTSTIFYTMMKTFYTMMEKFYVYSKYLCILRTY